MFISLLSRTSTRRPAPKVRRLSLALEDLEDRLVMSHAAATLPVAPPAHVAAQPQANVSVPISITGVNVTSLTQGPGGVLTLAGTVTGTLLGQAFTTPLTGTITPGTPATSTTPATCPILNLHLDPIHLSLLGLNVDTSPICLEITATEGPGNLLGNLLCGGLTDLLDSATALTNATPTANLSGLTGGLSSLLTSVTSQLGNLTAQSGSATPVTGGTTTQILDLSLGPVNLNLLGLNVSLDNCSDGPVTVMVSATTGSGNLLGNLLSGVAHLLDSPGNPLGGILSHVNQILGIVTHSTQLPTV